MDQRSINATLRSLDSILLLSNANMSHILILLLITSIASQFQRIELRYIDPRIPKGEQYLQRAREELIREAVEELNSGSQMSRMDEMAMALAQVRLYRTYGGVQMDPIPSDSSETSLSRSSMGDDFDGLELEWIEETDDELTDSESIDQEASIRQFERLRSYYFKVYEDQNGDSSF